MTRFAPVIKIVVFSMFISSSSFLELRRTAAITDEDMARICSGLNFKVHVCAHIHAIPLRPKTHTAKRNDNGAPQIGQGVLDRHNI